MAILCVVPAIYVNLLRLECELEVNQIIMYCIIYAVYDLLVLLLNYSFFWLLEFSFPVRSARPSSAPLRTVNVDVHPCICVRTEPAWRGLRDRQNLPPLGQSEVLGGHEWSRTIATSAKSRFLKQNASLPQDRYLSRPSMFTSFLTGLLWRGSLW